MQSSRVLNISFVGLVVLFCFFKHLSVVVFLQANDIQKLFKELKQRLSEEVSSY